MLKHYWLVELIAYNNIKQIRSNCILEGRRKNLPPLDLVFKNCVDIGFPSINILSVTRVSRKSAKYIKQHINSAEKYADKNVEEAVKLAKQSLNKEKETEEKKVEPVSNPS